MLKYINMSWAQELCIYMFVWMAKFGAAYGVRTGIHVGVDVLVNQMQSQGPQAGFIIFGLLAGAVFHRPPSAPSGRGLFINCRAPLRPRRI